METRKHKDGSLRFREKIYIDKKGITSPTFKTRLEASLWKEEQLGFIIHFISKNKDTRIKKILDKKMIKIIDHNKKEYVLKISELSMLLKVHEWKIRELLEERKNAFTRQP